MDTLSPPRRRSPRINSTVNLSTLVGEKETEDEQKRDEPHRKGAESGEEREQNTGKKRDENEQTSGECENKTEELKIRRRSTRSTVEMIVVQDSREELPRTKGHAMGEKETKNEDEIKNSGDSQELKRRKFVASAAVQDNDGQNILAESQWSESDSQELRRGRSGKRKQVERQEEVNITDEKRGIFSVKRKALEKKQSSPENPSDVKKMKGFSAFEIGLRCSQEESDRARPETESCATEEIFLVKENLADENKLQESKGKPKTENENFLQDTEGGSQTSRRGRSAAAVLKVENSSEKIDVDSPGSQEVVRSFLRAQSAEKEKVQKIEDWCGKTEEDSVDEMKGAESGKTDESAEETTEAEEKMSAVIEERESPKIPLYLRIKKAVIVKDLTDLKSPPPNSLAPSIKYTPPKPEDCVKDKEQEESGPRGEYAHFDTIEESIADKMKYQFEYATLRNTLRGNAQRAEEERRQALRNKRHPILLTEEQFETRLFMNERFRFFRRRRMELDLIRLNAELKQSMEIGNINVEKCIDCLDQLRDLNASPLMLVKYPDVMLTLSKVMLYEEDETISLKAEEASNHFEPGFLIPEFQELEDVVLEESCEQQEEFIAEFGLEKWHSDLKWQTLAYEQFKANLTLLPGHEDSEVEEDEASQEVPVQRTRLPRSAKREVSYSKLDDPEGLQIVPEVATESDDATDYEESEEEFSDDEDFHV